MGQLARVVFLPCALAAVLAACSGKTLQDPNGKAAQGGFGAATTEGGFGATPTEGGSNPATPEGGAGGVKSRGGAASGGKSAGSAGASGAVDSGGDGSGDPVGGDTLPGCGGGVRLAVHGANLYWTEPNTGRVRTMPLAGGAITNVATGQLWPTQIAVDNQGVYWVNQGDGSAASSKLLKKPLPLAAGAPLVLKAATELDKLPALAVHGGKVYYALHSDVHQLTLNQAGDAVAADIVVGISVNYDNPQNLAFGDPKGLAVNDTRVVWSTPDTRAGVESHTLTEVTDVNDQTGYTKLGVSIGAILQSGDVGIDANYGYWVNGERLVRNGLVSAPDLAQNMTVTPDSSFITAFALSPTNVYFSAESGQLFKHSLLPPTDPNDESTFVAPVAIASDQGTITSLVLDATKLYWVNSECVMGSTGL